MDWKKLREKLQAVKPGADTYASENLRLVLLDIIDYLEEGDILLKTSV